MHLGERIRKIRLEKGLSQTQTAGDHITRNMLSQIENGQATPSVKTLEHLANVLGVSVALLLSDEDGTVLSGARKKLKEGDMAGVVEAVKAAGSLNDEGNLLLAQAYSGLAMDAFLRSETEEALQMAALALSHNGKTLYCSRDTESQMRWLMAHCSIGGKEAEASMEAYRSVYDAWGWEARNHLLQARYHLSREQIQAAEREIWTITNLPEAEKPHYLLLRGWLAVRQEKYGNAISYLKQVENMEISGVQMRRELYRLMETAYRELDDYKSAYEYAAKQREL